MPNKPLAYKYWNYMFNAPKASVESEHELCVEAKNTSRLKEAYDKAHEVRQFEIELYWKRALYFWGFEAAFMVAFGTLLAKGNDVIGQFYFLLIISIFAFFFTLLWRLALKGAKKWQENWEAHIDLLEECVSGNLYKTVLHGKGNDTFYSVSKINEAINLLLLAMWSILCIICAIMAPVVSNAVGSKADLFWLGLLSVGLFVFLLVVFMRLLTCNLNTNFKKDKNELVVIKRAAPSVESD